MAGMDNISRVMLDLMDQFLTRPPELRSLEAVERILPFFRTRTPLFHNLSKDLIVNIALNASLRKVKKDHAIVWEGQEGNNFGIILKGSASVHSRKDQARVPQQDSIPIPRGHKDRTALVGPELCGLSTGSSFGEMIMSHKQQTYNSTIIADELTYVLLIHEELYARSFGAHRTEWENKVEFVNQSPLFRNLTPAIKNLLMENLKPRDIQFGNRFVKQGSVCNSLYFVCSGWGKVIADVRLSATQYEAMKAGSMAKDEMSGRKTARFVRPETKAEILDPSRPLSVIERRRCRNKYGYVAIERFLRQRELPVTTTGPNDIIGDIEIIINLPTYCANVECVETLRVYELSKYNFYQIIDQRCLQTYNLMQQGIVTKLYYRAQRYAEIPLYSLLYEQARTRPVKERKVSRDSRAGSIPRPSLFAKKILEVQAGIKKLTGIVRETEPQARIGDAAVSAKTTVNGESKDRKLSNSGENRRTDKQSERKGGSKQYTVEEFRALKKKMQAQTKLVSRALD